MGYNGVLVLNWARSTLRSNNFMKKDWWSSVSLIFSFFHCAGEESLWKDLSEMWYWKDFIASVQYLAVFFALELDPVLNEQERSMSSESSKLWFRIPFRAPASRPLAIATSPGNINIVQLYWFRVEIIPWTYHPFLWIFSLKDYLCFFVLLFDVLQLYSEIVKNI